MRNPLLSGLTLALALQAGSATAGSFETIGPANGQLTSISENGRIATGILGQAAWRWAQDRGDSLIVDATGSQGMSRWAQPIAGSALDADGNEVAAVFYSNSNLVGPVLVGGFPGAGGMDGTLSSAYDVSDNGIAVGLAYDENNHAVAFRWTQATGIARLPVNRPDNYSRANAISADGSVIVGWNDQDNGYRSAVIWVDGEAIDLVDADGEPVGEALAVTPDGVVVVGSGHGQEAWRWTAETGVQPIGFVGMMGLAYGFGVSNDGNVVVGASGFGFNREAVVWTPDTGMVTLASYLADNDVEVPAGWALMTATAVSGDGKTIAGWGLAPAPAGMASFLVNLRDDEPTEAILTAQGTVDWNDLAAGPFAGVATGTPVTLTAILTTEDAAELEPGQATNYRIVPGSLRMVAGEASETLTPTEFGPRVLISNDFPKSDGIHLSRSPTGTPGQGMEFELFNPGGDLFDSDDLIRINRAFGPGDFEKASWNIEAQSGEGLYVTLESVSIFDHGDVIFADGFE